MLLGVACVAHVLWSGSAFGVLQVRVVVPLSFAYFVVQGALGREMNFSGVLAESCVAA